MEIKIEIETHDNMLAFDLFESKELVADRTEKSISDNVSVRFEGEVFRKAEGLPRIIEMTLVLAKEVITPIILGIVSAWLYDKIKGRSAVLRIERTEVTINKQKIESVLIEKIEKRE